MHYQKALKKREDGNNTRIPERIEALLSFLPIPFSRVNDHPISKNGYQLLTGLTGTAIQAKKDESDYAIFLVHEFHTSKTEKKKLDKNEKDYSSFVRAIFENGNIDCSPGRINGPILVDGMDCYIGKIVSV